MSSPSLLLLSLRVVDSVSSPSLPLLSLRVVDSVSSPSLPLISLRVVDSVSGLSDKTKNQDSVCHRRVHVKHPATMKKISCKTRVEIPPASEPKQAGCRDSAAAGFLGERKWPKFPEVENLVCIKIYSTTNKNYAQAWRDPFTACEWQTVAPPTQNQIGHSSPPPPPLIRSFNIIRWEVACPPQEPPASPPLLSLLL